MRRLFAGVAALLLSGGMATAAGTHWGYAGEAGPTHWGALNADYGLCELGRNQSPVNITGAIGASLEPLQLRYTESGGAIVNNGHTIQVDFEPGSTLVVEGDSFVLKQVHFHAPSENEVEGKAYPLEAHLVHADSNGNLAVVGVLFERGEPNAALSELWAQMPVGQNAQTVLRPGFKAAGLLPGALQYYRFNGSLTTPPCSEGVRWFVLKTPLSASQEQIAVFTKVMGSHTNRPVQPLNARIIVQ
ncbi:carbonic anhydrase [Mesorhizobium sp. A623]